MIRRALSTGIGLSTLVLTMGILLAVLSVTTLAHAIRNEWRYLSRSVSGTGCAALDHRSTGTPERRRTGRLSCFILSLRTRRS